MAFEGFDLSKVDLSGLLNDDVVKKVSEKAEASEETTKSVIGNALPLLGSLFSNNKNEDELAGELASEMKEEPSLIKKILAAIIPFILNLFGKKDDDAKEEAKEEVKEEAKEEKEGLLNNLKEGLGNITSGLSGLFTGKKEN